MTLDPMKTLYAEFWEDTGKWLDSLPESERGEASEILLAFAERADRPDVCEVRAGVQALKLARRIAREMREEGEAQ